MGALLQDGQADKTVCRNINLTLTLTFANLEKKRNLKSETIKYGHESQWTGTRGLGRASSIYKRQTRLLVREGAPQKQDLNCQTVINIWLWAPDGARHQDLVIDWPSVAMWLWLWLWLWRWVWQQAGVIQNHENENVRNTGQGEQRHRKYKKLKFGGGQSYDRSSD
jgi:hypothetical protein